MKGSVRKRGDKWSYYFTIGKVDGKYKKKEKGSNFRVRIISTVSGRGTGAENVSYNYLLSGRKL